MTKKIIGYIPRLDFIYEIETEIEDNENFEEEFLYRPNYWCKDINHAWLKTNHPFKILRYIDFVTEKDFDISELSKDYQRYIYKKDKKYYREDKIFFLTYLQAFLWNFMIDKKWKKFPNGYTGIYREYYESGQLKLEFIHNNGEIIGEVKTFSSGGKEIKVESKHLFNFG